MNTGLASLLAPPETLAAVERTAKIFLSAGAGAWATLTGCDDVFEIEEAVCARRSSFVGNLGAALATDIAWSGDHAGRLCFVVENLGARVVVAHMMALMTGAAATPDDAALDAEGLDAYGEAVNSLVGQGAQALRGELGETIKLSVVGTRPVDCGDDDALRAFIGDDLEALGVAARFRFRDGPFMKARLFFDPSCIGHTLAAPAAATRAAAGAGDGEQEISAVNLEHAMHLRVPLVVILAARRMRMELIQEMAPGTIIEFRKQSGEPLDVFANNVRIATAEVVTTNQHFGVQIRHLVDPRREMPE